MKTKIFISAYACEPNLGSEIGVGWHWVLEMSKYFQLWVITRKSNQYGIETWLKENSKYSNINFIYFDLPFYLRFWKKGMKGVRVYYNIWQLCTNRIVKRTMRENNIKIFHHLTYGNALWAVSNYGKRQFFIWGPHGGTETIPSEFSKHYPLEGRIIEILRRFIVKTLAFNPSYISRCKFSNLILCKTEIQRDNIPKKFRNKAVLFTDVAVSNFRVLPMVKKNKKNHITKFILVGKLDPWRGFDLAIESFAKVVKNNPDVQLQIIGDGMDKNRLMNLISKLNMSRYIKMLGRVNQIRCNTLINDSDVFINPCLKEGAVTTAFDSIALLKPIICFETGGYTRYLTNKCAIVIPIRSRENMIIELKDAILKLTNIEERKYLISNTKKIRNQLTWEAKGRKIFNVITNAYRASK